MPDYRLTLDIVDNEGTPTTKTHKGTFVDQASAEAATTALIADYNNAIDGFVRQSSLAVIETFAGPAPGTRTVYRRASITLSLVSKAENANFKIPSVNTAINPTKSSINLAATQLTNLIGNFQAGGGWTISDGDTVDQIVDGKAVFDKSGEAF